MQSLLSYLLLGVWLLLSQVPTESQGLKEEIRAVACDPDSDQFDSSLCSLLPENDDLSQPVLSHRTVKEAFKDFGTDLKNMAKKTFQKLLSKINNALSSKGSNDTLAEEPAKFKKVVYATKNEVANRTIVSQEHGSPPDCTKRKCSQVVL